MEIIKKLALVSAISAASIGAQAELSLLEDNVLGDVTGQAGVTIEMEASISIDQVAYTDVGSLQINNIQIGGLTSQDTDQNAFLQNSVSGITGIPAGAFALKDAGTLAALMIYLGAGGPVLGSVDDTINSIPGAGGGEVSQPVVQAMVTAAMESAKAEELSGASSGPAYDAALAAVQGGGQVAVAVGLDLPYYISVVGASALNLNAYASGAFETAGVRESVKNIKQTIDVNAAGDLVIHVGSVNDTPILVGLQVGDVSLSNAAGTTTNTLLTNVALKAVIGPQDIVIHNGNGLHKDGSSFGSDEVSIDMDAYFAVADLDFDVTLGSGAIGVRDLQISDGGGYAKVSQTIYAQDSDYGVDTLPGTADDVRHGGLVVETGEMNMDITVGGIFLGSGDTATNDSIGSIAINGISMAGTTMTIYGHN
jgi:hypothetical protein